MSDICITSLFLDTWSSTITFDLLRYVIGATGVYLIVNIALARRLAGRKIRLSTPPLRQMRMEILASLRTVVIFSMVGAVIGAGSQLGVFQLYRDIAERGWVWLGVSIAVLLVAHDAWFYWSHRLMHRPRLFRLLHRLHHQSHNPTPFTSYSFDPGEAVINAIYLPLILLVVPAHPVAIIAFTGTMMLKNAVGHCGYEIYPAGADGRPLIGWMTTVTHHDLHHAHAGWNLGLYFTWWDRWMGTEHPRYAQEFARASGQKRLAAA